jgi:hypothetical protein
MSSPEVKAHERDVAQFIEKVEGLSAALWRTLGIARKK